ncbi:ttk family protein [Megaselia abdita]
MVLSACSPYFNALFVNHPEKHPIVILKDVPFADMRSLLDFMYRGEVSVDQERLTAFLRVAESLRIKGLTEVTDDKPANNNNNSNINNNNNSKENGSNTPPPQLHRIQPFVIQHKHKSQQQTLNTSNNNSPSTLLGTALSAGQKRKRGRPRKLSGSSNGTGNDFDEIDNDNDSKMDDASDDNNGGDNGPEILSNDQLENTIESRKNNKSKESESNSVNMNKSPELSQRLFGIVKPTIKLPEQSKTQADKFDPSTHLPTALGLRINPLAKRMEKLEGINITCATKSPSSNKKENNKAISSTSPVAPDLSVISAANPQQNFPSSPQKQTSQTTNSIHHQFLMHIAANPILNIKDYNNENLSDNNPLSPSNDSSYCGIHPTPTNKPVQRRRIRRKAQSSNDDQAEHLTEMSVRGLDLFRYASIQEGVYQCIECAKENVQKTFKNKYSFQRHAFLYHEGKHRKVFPCPVCGKEFSRPDKMKNHMKTTHEMYTFPTTSSKESPSVPQSSAIISTSSSGFHHPFNYLISAAAGETIFSHQSIDLDHRNINQPPPLIKLHNDIIFGTPQVTGATLSGNTSPSLIHHRRHFSSPTNSLKETSIIAIKEEEVK